MFEQVPELYDRARPAYPSQVYEDIAALADLPEAARIVEIGGGTGRATAPPRGQPIDRAPLDIPGGPPAFVNGSGLPRTIGGIAVTW